MGRPKKVALAPDYPKDVGRALSQYRLRNGLTLQDISLATGVSIGTLSKLENDKGLPSFRTLMRIVQNLDLSGSGQASSPAAIPSPATARKTVTRKGEALVAESNIGIYHIHAGDLLQKEMFPMIAVITLHDVPPLEQWTRHAGDEFVYVLTGAVAVFVEHYSPYFLQAGESTYYDSGMRHIIVSNSPEDATVISISTSKQDPHV